LEGLEATEKHLSELERTWRIDAEFFQRQHLRLAERLLKHRLESAAQVATVSDGNHFSISESFVEEGIPYYRGQDAAGHFFIEQATANAITREAFEQPFMKRSHLQQGDVLLSIIGTVGETSLVKTAREATCSCKLAILRPQTIAPEYLAAYLSSSVGKSLTERWKRGAVQTGLLLEDMDQIPIARFSPAFEMAVKGTVDRAFTALEAGRDLLGQAEQNLLHALGLDTWTPPDALTYVRSSREAFAAGRLDAQFFTPRVEQLLARLARDGLRLSDVAPARHERFEPTGSGNFDYIEIGSLGADSTAAAERVAMAEAPSRATQHVRSGDVITSTVRPIRRLSALIAPHQDGAVCSSGFVVLQPQGISSEVLLTYLRLPLVCELMDLHTSATMYPAISESDLLALPIPAIPSGTQAQVQQAVRQSAQARQRATRLLDVAKRAVEIAIEDSEAAALAYLAAANPSETAA
jgi:type I restriction enzyme S subunit